MIEMRYLKSLCLAFLLVATSFPFVQGFVVQQRRGTTDLASCTCTRNKGSSTGSAPPTCLLNSASSSSPFPTSPMKRKKKKLKKGKNADKNHNKRPSSGPISLQELAEHVSHEYIHGPGGLLRDLERKRNRFSRQYQQVIEAAAANQHQQEQSDMMRKLDRHPALVLNADFQPLSYLPLSIWNWQESVKAVFSGKVTVVDVYPDVTIRAANLHVPLPSVIALTDYVVPTGQYNQPAFTKRNVFLRDEYRCQYCNDHFHTRDLSLDHVVPRCRGGALNWENAVTCCMTCNGKKGSMGLQEIQYKWGMRLRAEPKVPTQFDLAMTASRMLPRSVHSTWEPYLPYQLHPTKQSMMSVGTSATNHEEKQFHLEEEG